MVSMFQKDVKDIPTLKVVAMRKQGLSDNQIIQSLQHEGYDSCRRSGHAHSGGNERPPETNDRNWGQTNNLAHYEHLCPLWV